MVTAYSVARQVSTFFVFGAIVGGAVSAHACPNGQHSVLGMCVPNCGGSICGGLEHAKKEVMGQIGGAGLQAWIQASRNSAIGTSQPIPLNIRQQLTGYIDEDVMNRARFKVGDNGILNAANNIERVNGRITAVTLIDVIVFRNAQDAYGNPSLWAHELTHVQQYRDMGVRDFAIRYARNSDPIEADAYAKGDGYAAWAASRGIAPGGGPGNPYAAPIPNGGASFPAPGPVGAPYPPPMPVAGAVCRPQMAPPCLLPRPFQLGSYCTCASPRGVFAGNVFVR